MGYLLLSCDESEQATVVPEVSKSVTASEQDANKRVVSIGPDLRITGVVQRSRAFYPPVGDPRGRSVAISFTFYVTNQGRKTAFASPSSKIFMRYFQRREVPTLAPSELQPDGSYLCDVNKERGDIDRNIAPGATIEFYGTIFLLERDLPPSRIIDLRCFVDATDLVNEMDEANNREGQWKLDFSSLR